MNAVALYPDSVDAPLGTRFLTRDAIDERVRELGAEISAYYAGTVPVLVTVLRGATIFAADLVRAMSIPHEMDFLALAANDDDVSGVRAQVLKDLQLVVNGRDILLVEDIVDTGVTLEFVRRFLATHEPASVEVATLLDRPRNRRVETRVRFRGFDAPNSFFVGYGFDYHQRYRNLPDIHELALDDEERIRLLQLPD